MSQTEQLEYEPKVHLVDPYEVTGTKAVTLKVWPLHTDDNHILLQSDTLLTVCEPSIKIRQAYLKKIGKTEDDFKPDPVPVLLNEDENVPDDEDYEPRYVEEPVY